MVSEIILLYIHAYIHTYIHTMILTYFCSCYWITILPFIGKNFMSIMSGRRFELILNFLQLNNGQEQPSTNSVNYDKLY